MASYAILQTFYASREWITFRLALIAERGNRCQKCGKIIPHSVEIHAHHKIELMPENVHDKMISMNPDNILLLCRDCHDKVHARFGYSTGKKVYLVYGPPCSGKSTFVLQNKSRNDIVVDMDRLYSAVTMLPEHDKPNELLSNVRGLYSLLLDNIKTRHGKWRTAWVIGGYADKYRRTRLADDLGAELIYCEATKEECIGRLAMDNERQYRQAEWIGYIEKWFEQYTE
jgi:hypothetical protein